MTIAAGFVCSDGVVLCADTELTSSYKQQGQKLWIHSNSYGLSIAVTGAGDYVLLKLANEHISHRLSKAMSVDDVRHGIVERVLASIHKDHVDAAPESLLRSGEYGLSLLVAIQYRSRALLFESSRTALSPVVDYRCVGSGSPVANLIAGTMFSPSLPVLWGRIFASYLIQQTKTHGLYCGGNSNIAVMSNDGQALLLKGDQVRELEDVATSLHEAVGSVLFSCVSPWSIILGREADGALLVSDSDACFTNLKAVVNIARQITLNEDAKRRVIKQSIGEPKHPANQRVQKSPKHDRKVQKPSRV